MSTLNKVGERIKHLREQKNYSQQYLANTIGISQKAYSKLETGETKISVDYLLKLSETLEATINEILGIDGNAVYNNFSTHNGDGIVTNKHTGDKVAELYEKLLKSKDDDIARLSAQNDTILKTMENIAKR